MQAIFDFGEAEKRRDEGIRASSEAAGDEWSAYAIEFVRTFLVKNPTLHVDELWKSGMTVPSSPRALGAVMQHMIRSGWAIKIVTPEGYTAALPSVASNQQLKPVWRSCLYQTYAHTQRFPTQ